jgi:hypothetical protein
MKREETDTPIAGSYKSVTGLFLCSHLCSEMPHSPAIRVLATHNVFCLQYIEKPHLNAAWKTVARIPTFTYSFCFFRIVDMFWCCGMFHFEEFQVGCGGRGVENTYISLKVKIFL